MPAKLLVFAPILVIAFVALALSYFHSRVRPQIAARMLLTLLVLSAFATVPVLIELTTGALFEVPLAEIWFHDIAHAQGFHTNIGRIVAIFLL